MEQAPRYFQAVGKVQQVMFRQTLMRAAQRLGLRAGATNLKHQSDTVRFTLVKPKAISKDQWMSDSKYFSVGH